MNRLKYEKILTYFALFLAMLVYFAVHSLCGVAVAADSFPVFPGAEGFGTTTRAAYGGHDKE